MCEQGIHNISPGLADDKLIIYTGTSMYPTLRNLDYLRVKPCSLGQVRIGDVVVYSSQNLGNAGKVAHRVKSSSASGLLVIGDNRSEPDSELVTEKNIIGKVVSAKRGGKWVTVYGGFLGNSKVVFMRFKKMLKSSFSKRFIKTVYHKCSEFKLLKRIIPLNRALRIVMLQTKTGKKLQLLCGKYTVGYLEDSSAQWKIRPLFRLFIDQSSLPCFKDIPSL